jgi:hypothetical protein
MKKCPHEGHGNQQMILHQVFIRVEEEMPARGGKATKRGFCIYKVIKSWFLIAWE